MISKTWNHLRHNLKKESDTIHGCQGISDTVDWCQDNLPELDRIIAMENTIESQRDEIDSLVAQLKGE